LKAGGSARRGGRQSEQTVGLHSEHRDAATHLFEPTIGAPPVQALAHGEGEPIAIQRRLLREQCANELDL
jgi:hypothetical protein